MNNPLILLVFLISLTCNAVVKRHDVSPDQYEVEQVPSYFIDMPHDGAAVLIDKHWLLTAGHVIFYDYRGKDILIHGVENIIVDVLMHPDYKPDPGGWGQGDAKPLIDFLRNRSDIALVKLKNPVEHVTPILRYRGKDEMKMQVTVYGRGATGTGLTGQQLETKEDTFWQKVGNFFSSPFSNLDPTLSNKPLNKYNNIIESIEVKWLSFTFDQGEQALPLEGSVGSGDSGGPAVIYKGEQPYLVGLASWQDYQGELKDLVGGQYGAKSMFVRVSTYNDWIDETVDKESKLKKVKS